MVCSLSKTNKSDGFFSDSEIKQYIRNASSLTGYVWK